MTSRALASLEHLDLSYCDLYDDGAERLSASLSLPSLRSLNLRHCYISAEGRRRLLASPRLEGLSVELGPLATEGAAG